MGYAELRAIHHDHEYVRQSLALIRAALTCHATPPDGHAYWCILRDAAGYLVAELPRHMAVEEARIFPLYRARPGADRLDDLRAEHREIARLAHELLAVVDALAPGTADQRWPVARARAQALEALLRGHMDAEEALLRKLGKADATGPGVALHP